MSDKKIVTVNTEFVEAKGDLSTDLLSLFTLGLHPGSSPEHYSTTVVYNDGTVNNGSGSTKEDSIKDAVKK